MTAALKLDNKQWYTIGWVILFINYNTESVFKSDSISITK